MSSSAVCAVSGSLTCRGLHIGVDDEGPVEVAALVVDECGEGRAASKVSRSQRSSPVRR